MTSGLAVLTDVRRKTVPPAGSTFSVVRLDESYAETLSPHGYWSMQFYLPDDAYLKWESTVPRGASLAVYGRRNALPTHTQYDVHHLLRGYSRRLRRTSGVSPVRRTSRVSSILRRTSGRVLSVATRGESYPPHLGGGGGQIRHAGGTGRSHLSITSRRLTPSPRDASI